MHLSEKQQQYLEGLALMDASGDEIDGVRMCDIDPETNHEAYLFVMRCVRQIQNPLPVPLPDATILERCVYVLKRDGPMNTAFLIEQINDPYLKFNTVALAHTVRSEMSRATRRVPSLIHYSNGEYYVLDGIQNA